MVLIQQSALTQKFWQNTNYLQLINRLYAVAAIFAQPFNICSSKFERITTPIAPWLRAWQQWLMAICRGVTRGAQIPRLRVTMGPPNPGGAEKSKNVNLVLSSMHYIFFPTTSVSNMGAPNLLLAPCAI